MKSIHKLWSIIKIQTGADKKTFKQFCKKHDFVKGEKVQIKHINSNSYHLATGPLQNLYIFQTSYEKKYYVSTTTATKHNVKRTLKCYDLSDAHFIIPNMLTDPGAITILYDYTTLNNVAKELNLKFE